ncbi:arginyltransferase [Enterovibrio sp. ZSDZ35]|uniref:Aspartate/glutamate leucyltransferase n=1 Tax=Enterovibrio qingdaonensis TaxID=2899818 RepID=A0ABT5QK62_9GAMM|nr:arginyltransferase [Enterovibrio sp. ZSDZ35]MDD1781249.1 arginyltransferase [Enterovibrio sp. ZSDZ35]
MKGQTFRVGVTPPSTCNYLPEQQETIAVVIDPELHSEQGYSWLIQSGFRRSGNSIYRPYCQACSACQSLRVDTQQFHPSKSQKRQINQLKRLNIELKSELDDGWFDLYDRYISARHSDGSMFPANKDDFLSFVGSEWQPTRYVHIYEEHALVAVAITDITTDGFSAIYSFFDPDHPWSLGSLCVLAQLELAKQNGVPWLYLGFQIDACQAMSYKIKYRPYQRFIAGSWQPCQMIPAKPSINE